MPRARLYMPHLELRTNDLDFRVSLLEALAVEGVSYRFLLDRTTVLTGATEDVLHERIYESVIGPFYYLTEDAANFEQAIRERLKRVGIRFIEQCCDGKVAFVLNITHKRWPEWTYPSEGWLEPWD
jgi:hypothetical protein